MGFNLMDGGSGAFGGTTKRAKKKVERARQIARALQLNLATWPALAFVFPYHEMLLRGLLKVDEHDGVKTRSGNWNYRGPVLLYTSKGRYHRIPTESYKLDPTKFPIGAIVGVATIVDSRPLTGKEKMQMLQNFNNISFDNAVNISLGTYPYDYVEPLPIGVFLKDIKRFKKPVPFKPKPGAIGIMRVPVKLVSKALKEVGIDPKKL